MDDERWKMAFMTKSQSEDTSSSNDNKTGPQLGKSTTREVQLQQQPASSRLHHDIMQAMAMQQRRQKQQQEQQPRSNSDRSASNRRAFLTNENVHLGIRGLDQAQILADRGELQNAMKLYELALEVLIRYLREGVVDDHDDNIMGTLDRKEIEERMEIAFSQAESVKAKLQSTTVSTRLSPNSTSAFQSLSNALTAVLSSPSTSSPLSKGQGQPTSVITKKASVATTTRSQSTKRPSSSVIHSQRTPTNLATRSLATGKSAAQPQQQTEFRRVVYEELFVNPADLQKTTWNDIAGLEDVKQSLQETAILPLLRPDLFTGLRRPQNVLLTGPPGTGKTMLVRAVAHESGSNLFVCSASTLTSKWMGDAEKLVRVLFQVAREMAPSIIFVDEIDSLLSRRKSEGEHEASRRLKTEFMVQMDGIVQDHDNEHHILVLGCTNCPWDVDSAIIRRFPRRIFVPLPDAAARRGLLQHLLLKAGKHNLTKRQVDMIVQRTEGFSCSDISGIASEASFGPIRSLSGGGLQAIRDIRVKELRPISFIDFDAALRHATKSVGEAQLRKYEEWQRQQAAS